MPRRAQGHVHPGWLADCNPLTAGPAGGQDAGGRGGQAAGQQMTAQQAAAMAAHWGGGANWSNSAPGSGNQGGWS
jgi:hypothetical protein